MQNIFYNITEKNNTEDNDELNNIDENKLLNELNEEYFSNVGEIKTKMRTDTSHALELEYNTNYGVKDLGKILDYYGMSKRKLRKDEMVQLIVFFEEDANNFDVVSRRRRLWENIKELQDDKYFSKFIIF